MMLGQETQFQTEEKTKVKSLALSGLKLICPKQFKDGRGYFLESFRQDMYQALGFPGFVQDNHAFSLKNTLRGMHFQKGPGQAKLVTVAFGSIFDVAVDMRKDSKTFGKWQSVILDDENCRQFFIPEGFAHGYLVLSEKAHVLYKVSRYFDPQEEAGFSYRDSFVDIDWPVKEPLLSSRDANAASFRETVLC